MPAPWRSSVRILGSDCYRRIVSLKKGSLHEIDYTVRVPYTSWMRNAGLSLRQISRDCCRGEVLTDEVLTADRPALCEDSRRTHCRDLQPL